MKHGQDLESAYTRAMRNKGREFPAGRVVYMYDGQHLWYALPSGRVLCYPFAKLEAEGVSYLKAAWKPAADATEWPRARSVARSGGGEYYPSNSERSAARRTAPHTRRRFALP
jgi:hypothetical protein